MKEIPLTQGYVVLVDDADYNFLMQWKWRYHNSGYAVRTDARANGMKSILMHRVIMNAPNDLQVDHRDRNKLNNTRSNLRLATSTQNRCNTVRDRPSKVSKFRGVSWFRQRGMWRSRIQVGRKSKTIGYFHDEIEAAHAYDSAARIQHGDFAITNF